MANDLSDFNPVYRDTSIKIDKVAISYEKSGAAKVRFTINRKVFSHGVGRLDNNLYKDHIIGICKGIAVDLRLGRFNPNQWKNTYFGAKPNGVKPDSDSKKDDNHIVAVRDNTQLDRLSTVWDNYLRFKGDSLSYNTLSNAVSNTSYAIKTTLQDNNNLDDLRNIELCVNRLSGQYADTSLIKIMTYLNAAFTIAMKQGKIIGNPIFLYLENVRKRTQNKSVEAYSLDDAKTIINTFYDNRYPIFRRTNTLKNGEVKEYFYPDSKERAKHYAPLIEFRFLTGFRPSEAHALTWNDFRKQGDRTEIIVNKRLSVDGKKIEEGTKNRVWCRYFTVNDDLQKLLDSIPKIANKYNLIFPSYGDRLYINNKTTSGPSRVFTRICSGLFNDGLIDDNLSYYACRHTFITHVMRSKEIDVATLAKLVGNSPDVLLKRYFASEKDVTIPTLF
jgi:integrase